MDLRAARLAQPGYFLGDTIATELRGRLGRRRPQVARIVDEALHGGHERVGSAQLEQLAEPLCLCGEGRRRRVRARGGRSAPRVRVRGRGRVGLGLGLGLALGVGVG